MKFKVLRGLCSHGGKTYMAGDVFECKADLVKLHGPQKFERVKDSRVKDSRNPPPLDDLLRMTLPQLRQCAEDLGVDLGDAELKKDVLETICRSFSYEESSGPIPA